MFTLPNQFIQFGEIDSSNQLSIPVAHDAGLCFYFNIQKGWEQTQTELAISLATIDGKTIATDACSIYLIDYELEQLTATYYAVLNNDVVQNNIAINQCFRLKAEWQSDTDNQEAVNGTEYSNPLVYIDNSENQLSTLKFFCKEGETLGFQFATYKYKNIVTRKGYNTVLLPILLTSPQFAQTDKIYETRNGEQIVLYATIHKEYEGETEYIPETWHQKIVAALSCDEIYINGERVTKSDSYEIDHDNYTFSKCGIRLTRATFKVKTNVTQRNSNY